MAKSKSTLEKKPPKGKLKKRANANAIREFIRPHVPVLIEESLDMALSKKVNDNAKLGAIKMLLNKVIPDLKSVEHKGNAMQALQVIIQDYGKGEVVKASK